MIEKIFSENRRPYIIAEISANHNGRIETAYELINQAKEAGADAVKFQTYTADTLTVKSDLDDFKIKSGLWAGSSLYDLYEKAHMPWSWQKELFAYCKSIGIEALSTPFDDTAVDFLEDIGVTAYKIASFECNDLELLEKVAKTRKPIILSTGMATEREMQDAIDCLLCNGTTQLVLLHCISSYPAKTEDSNLLAMMKKKKFGFPVGLSDHSENSFAATLATAMGARVIEKHFTLDKTGTGPDDSFSMERSDLVRLIKDTTDAFIALGDGALGPAKAETDNLIFRRSLYFVKDVKKGAQIKRQDIKSIRPGFGLAPKHINDVIGSTAQSDIKKYTRVTLNSYEKK